MRETPEFKSRFNHEILPGEIELITVICPHIFYEFSMNINRKFWVFCFFLKKEKNMMLENIVYTSSDPGSKME